MYYYIKPKNEIRQQKRIAKKWNYTPKNLSGQIAQKTTKSQQKNAQMIYCKADYKIQK